MAPPFCYLQSCLTKNLAQNVAPTGSIEHCPRDAELRRKMEGWKLFIIFLVVIAVSSCATERLWENTNPKEYVRVDAPEFTEEVLQSKGIAYQRFQDGTLYMEKSDLRKMGDYALRIFVTPATLVIDAVPVGIVVGVLYLGGDPTGLIYMWSGEDWTYQDLP